MLKNKQIEIFTTVETLQVRLNELRNEGNTIGFTPTLGALHEGHASLFKKSIEENDISVCSIFVNPTQFNVKSDLDKYPRTIKSDTKLLQKVACNILFLPSTKEIYPKGTSKSVKVNLDGLDKLLEGAFRPGHFDGVVQVVHRLLEIVHPDHLYMGQKDFQQFTIIQKMIDELKLKTKLVVCPIKREKDGLAMSSRNVRLTKINRKRATILHDTLQFAKAKYKEFSPTELSNYAKNKLNIEDFKMEYFKFIDGHTLQELKTFKGKKYIVAVTAVWSGEIRLIDNMILYKA
jgi:pantoate--beta-alanine ligase